MGRTILPSGEEISVTPRELLRYAGPDAIRQFLHQEKLHWGLKVNKDSDYIDPQSSHKYATEVHNDGDHMRMELRSFPDNGNYGGYSGINIDSGQFGLSHNFDKWPETISGESKATKVNRLTIGATAQMPNKSGVGLDDNGNLSYETSNRTAAIVFDPCDGRAYLLSNDDTVYVNNEGRNYANRIPSRAVARIADIPTRITQLQNDMDIVADPNFKHTDNNFTYSNKFLLDNLDDRTFVYPEISKDVGGSYIENLRIGLNGTHSYSESDGNRDKNIHPDNNNDRGNNDSSNYNVNINTSGVYHSPGFLPGIFKSLEELEKVDLLHQKQSPLTNASTPGSRRPYNYYEMDGLWSINSYEENPIPSYRKNNITPSNMTVNIPSEEPIPYETMTNSFNRSKLYQWRYNRIDISYPSTNVNIRCIESGHDYEEGDLLRWSFGNDVFQYRVTQVGVNGEIQEGHYISDENISYEEDPSTHGIGVEFINSSSIGNGARFVIESSASIDVHATQLKNNLYAYVDITPTVRSDNESIWSDNKLPDTQGGKIQIRSTAAGPAYSGINSGRGGPSPSEYTSNTILYEHGGNPTAGVHVHLFRYVIDTQSPRWEMVDGVKVYLGKWVDQGPLGVERPCDIKALFLSNPDCNNFNNYYKFGFDLFLDSLNRHPDAITANNPNAVCVPLIHMDQRDPTNETKFSERRVDPNTNEIVDVDITQRVLFINCVTGIMWVYNTSYKNDTEHGYVAPGWIQVKN